MAESKWQTWKPFVLWGFSLCLPQRSICMVESGRKIISTSRANLCRGAHRLLIAITYSQKSPQPTAITVPSSKLICRALLSLLPRSLWCSCFCCWRLNPDTCALESRKWTVVRSGILLPGHHEAPFFQLQFFQNCLSLCQNYSFLLPYPFKCLAPWYSNLT